MIPKGRLVFINSEDQLLDKNVEASPEIKCTKLLSFLNDFKQDPVKVLIGRQHFSKNQKRFYSRALSAAGYSNFKFILLSKENIIQKKTNTELSDAKVIFFVGDHTQSYEILKNSPILKIWQRRYMTENGFTIGGMSDGASCISQSMIIKNDYNYLNSNKEIKLCSGLGFLHNCIIDAKYIQETEYDQLAETVVKHQNLMAIGLGNDTAFIVENGQGICKGDGTIIVVRTSDVLYRSDKVNSNYEFYLKNLKGRVLINGCTVNLADNAEIVCEEDY